VNFGWRAQSGGMPEKIPMGGGFRYGDGRSSPPTFGGIVRTYTNLWDEFISVQNFVRAYKDARKGKGKQRSVAEFRHGWSLRLYALRRDVMEGRFHTSPYRSMTITEPKKRTIYKLPFCPDRIVQHALVNALAPVLEKKLIADTYSCIPGRGQVLASQRCMEAVRRNKYCLKCDVRHFYPSIDQNILSAMYHRIIKDGRLMAVIDDIIFSFPGGKNCPIGNYLSQWSGNFYLSVLDDFVKRELHVRDYLRYCDDFLLFSDDKAFLHECRKKIGLFLRDRLRLEYSRSDVFSVRQGVDFCGYRHFDNFVLLRKSTKLRQERRLREIRKAVEGGSFDRDKCRSSLDSMAGWMRHAKTHRLKEKLGLSELRELVA